MATLSHRFIRCRAGNSSSRNKLTFFLVQHFNLTKSAGLQPPGGTQLKVHCCMVFVQTLRFPVRVSAVKTNSHVFPMTKYLFAACQSFAFQIKSERFNVFLRPTHIQSLLQTYPFCNVISLICAHFYSALLLHSALCHQIVTEKKGTTLMCMSVFSGRMKM